MGQTRNIWLRRVCREKPVSVECISILFAGIKALKKVNIEMIMGVIKRDSGPAWFSWEQSVLTKAKQ